MMRVLHTISGLHIGGAGRLLLTNATHLDPGRFESVVCHYVGRRDLEPAFAAAGVRTLRVPYRGKSSFPGAVARTASLIRSLGVRIVHTNLALDSLIARLAGRICGVPVVSTLHAADVPPPLLRGRGSVLGALEDLTGRLLVTRFVAVSETAKAVTSSRRGIPAERIAVIHSGVDTGALGRPRGEAARRTAREACGVEGAFPVIVSIGRLHPVKGQRHLVEMMPLLLRRYPRAALVLVGGGELLGGLQADVGRLGLQRCVFLRGRDPEARRFLAAGDLYVSASLSEGLGIAVLEAMSAGLPVVASRIPAHEELIEDGVTGFLAAPGSAPALAEAVVGALEDRARLDGVRARARARAVERFDVRRAVSSLEEFYLRVAATRR